MRASKSSLLPLVFALAACSSAENETPVDLTPGQYEIVFAGLNGASGTKSRCITPTAASNFPLDPVSRFMPAELRDSCESQGQRKGNALTGTLTCRFAGTDSESELTLKWSGTMASDNFEVTADGDLKDMNAPEGEGPNHSHVTVTGKRTGECNSL